MRALVPLIRSPTCTIEGLSAQSEALGQIDGFLPRGVNLYRPRYISFLEGFKRGAESLFLIEVSV